MTQSSSGAYYFITIVDNYSKAVWVYMLHDKSQVENNIFDYFTLVQRIQQVGEDSEEQQWYWVHANERVFSEHMCDLPKIVCRHSSTKLESWKEA